MYMLNKQLKNNSANRKCDEILQSKVIDLLRFPLALGVVSIHLVPETFNVLETDVSFYSLYGLQNILKIAFSHVIPSIAVPTFFMISGFLFFLNFREWSLGGYIHKMKTRARTLILPYILWNIGIVGLWLVFYFLCACLREDTINTFLGMSKEFDLTILYNYNTWGQNASNWFGYPIENSGPFIIPLWFLRDLIIVTLLTPIIYFLIKKTGPILLLLLLFCYVSQVSIPVPGISVVSLFFFSLGAYFSLNRINMVSEACRYKRFTTFGSLICGGVAIAYDGTQLGHEILPFFVICGAFCVLWVAAYCVNKFNWQINKTLTASCFFIYALHCASLPLTGAPVNFIYSKASLLFGQIIGYIIAPFITVFICILVYWTVRRFLPRVANIMSGFR